MSDQAREHRHPSYGMVQVNRHTHSRGAYLFGSSVVDHYQTFSLRVSHGMAYEDEVGTGEMRYLRTERCGIVEVALSAAQFVELMTTHNVGDGVPCTITRLAGAVVEAPTRPKTDVERAHGAFEKRMKDFGARLDGFVEAVQTAAQKLPKKDQGALTGAADALRTEVSSNIPFFLRTFHEAAARIVDAKKAEVEAYLSTVLRNAGLTHLRALAPRSDADEVLALPVRADDSPAPQEDDDEGRKPR